MSLLNPTCGFRGKAWLERFLRAAEYPPHEGRALVIRLFGETSPPARQIRARSNIPAAACGHFVMRSAAYQAVIDGLISDLPLLTHE
ncbi:MAG: hypothetical protein Fur005_47390 [Roseiflexaceae bacterium]